MRSNGAWRQGGDKAGSRRGLTCFMYINRQMYEGRSVPSRSSLQFEGNVKVQQHYSNCNRGRCNSDEVVTGLPANSSSNALN